jgi:spore maturation protein CgeB
VFIYRGDLIRAKTIKRLKTVCPDAVLVGYNNDDPFSPRYPFWYWRHFIHAIPVYDLVLAYRLHNVSDFAGAGAARVHLLRSWFVPERDFKLDIEKKYDVVFVGHAEDDGRQEILETIVESGYSLGLFGPSHYWESRLQNSAGLKHLLPVCPVWGADYNRVLNEGKVALCFFSALNRDTYTRRCFEIPASGTVMLAQYSEDLASLFTPDEEAVFFHNGEELVAKLKWLLENDDIRHRIADAGLQKVHDAGHDVNSRVRQLLDWCAEARQSRKQGGAKASRIEPLS